MLAYYNKQYPDLIRFTSLENIDYNNGFISKENYLNNSNNMLRNDLYSLMIDILRYYYGDKYINGIVINQEVYEEYFQNMFVYSYEVV